MVRVGNELVCIKATIERGHLSGDGYFTKKGHQWLEELIGCEKALLTHSCTAALLINDSRYMERAEIIRDKGTIRSKFFRGEVYKYTWVDIGSSYLLSDINGAPCTAQNQV